MAGITESVAEQAALALLETSAGPVKHGPEIAPGGERDDYGRWCSCSACAMRSRDEKAAHLLYFVIKDHPFSDGNKRIGSFLFMLYLKQEGAMHRFNPQALTTDGNDLDDQLFGTFSRCKELLRQASRAGRELRAPA